MSYSNGYNSMRECITSGGDIAKTLNNLFNSRAKGGQANLARTRIEFVQQLNADVLTQGKVHVGKVAHVDFRTVA